MNKHKILNSRRTDKKSKPQGKIFIISGPSGSGKTTIYRRLLKSPQFKGRLVKSISVTTRNKREGEVHGRDYIFVTPKMFANKKKQGQFLESMEVFGNYYGTPKKNVVDHLRAGQNVLLCIDVEGAKIVSRHFPEAIKIFIKTPTMAILKQRLESRGTDSPEHIKTRLNRAKEELKESKDYQYIVINGNIEECYGIVEQIIDQELNISDDGCCQCCCPH